MNRFKIHQILLLIMVLFFSVGCLKNAPGPEPTVSSNDVPKPGKKGDYFYYGDIDPYEFPEWIMLNIETHPMNVNVLVITSKNPDPKSDITFAVIFVNGPSIISYLYYKDEDVYLFIFNPENSTFEFKELTKKEKDDMKGFFKKLSKPEKIESKSI